jgi:1-aminocyclopropane-1-carboxylate deaminase/D-cysteine desulfhydrase-like pyridoxal-dependent ACC family enzyme
VEKLLANKISIAQLPTPIHHMKQLSAHYGQDIYFKRDDLTGLEFTGNKIRKLEYLIFEAQKQEADTIITTGGIQSNHARASRSLFNNKFPSKLVFGASPVNTRCGSYPNRRHRAAVARA